MSAACPTRVIAGAQSWIEGEAVRQLEQTATLEGMALAMGLPDLHPGRGTPIGAAFVTRGRFYPHLVGNDIGCVWRHRYEPHEHRAFPFRSGYSNEPCADGEGTPS